jgi:hypothetical protein
LNLCIHVSRATAHFLRLFEIFGGLSAESVDFFPDLLSLVGHSDRRRYGKEPLVLRRPPRLSDCVMGNPKKFRYRVETRRRGIAGRVLRVSDAVRRAD